MARLSYDPIGAARLEPLVEAAMAKRDGLKAELAAHRARHDDSESDEAATTA